MCSALTPAEQLWALVHDAHEILSGESTREWKADETRARQSDADVRLRMALGIGGVDLLKVHMADIKHGAIEHEEMRSGVYSYHFSWYAARHKWADLFEELRGEL